MLRKVIFVSFYAIVVFWLSSCVLKQQGTFFGEVNIGTNSNDIVIYYEGENTNYLFYSFQDFYNSQLGDSDKSTFSDSFSLNFTVFGGKVYVINRISNVIKLISVEGKRSYLEGVFPYPQGVIGVSDFAINDKKEIGFLFISGESEEGEFYKFGYSLLNYSNGVSNLVVFNDIVFTNVFAFEPFESGFLVFERRDDGRLIVSSLSSEGRTLYIDLNQYTDSVNGLFVSSATVLKGRKIAAKFEDPTNYTTSTIVVFNLSKTNLEKVSKINVGNENFSLVSSVNDSYLLAATFKNNAPSVIMFDPMSDFKISYEYYIDLMYPSMFRGFKITKNGKIFTSYVDFPDNKVLFYSWNILSRL